MAEAYIVAAKRTAGGRKGGALADWHPGDLGAQTLNAIVDNSESLFIFISNKFDFEFVAIDLQ